MNDWDSTIRATFADTQALDLHRPAAPEQFLCDCLLSQEFLQAALDVGDSLAAKPDAAAGNDDGGSGDAGFLKWVTDRTALRLELRAALVRVAAERPVEPLRLLARTLADLRRGAAAQTDDRAQSP